MEAMLTSLYNSVELSINMKGLSMSLVSKL